MLNQQITDSQSETPTRDYSIPTKEEARNRPRVIKNVDAYEQNGFMIYSFRLTVDELIALGYIERFKLETMDAVNRAAHQDHALEIAEAMSDRELIWIESFVVVLKGEWRHDAQKRTLTPAEDAYLSIDDGQHRLIGLRIIDPAVRASLGSFRIEAPSGLSIKQRMKAFMMQDDRLPFDPRLGMAQKHALDQWDDPLDGVAYRISRRLNEDPDSVLRGLIAIDEASKRNDASKPIHGKGIHNAIRKAIAKKAPLLGGSTEEEQYGVIKHLLRAASEVWSFSWNSSEHVLLSARGINTVLFLLSKSPQFVRAIGDELSKASIKTALSHGAVFRWGRQKRVYDSAQGMVVSLDTTIGNGLAKSQLPKIVNVGEPIETE